MNSTNETDHVHTSHTITLAGKVFPSSFPVRQTPAQAYQFVNLMSEMLEQAETTASNAPVYRVDRVQITVQDDDDDQTAYVHDSELFNAR